MSSFDIKDLLSRKTILELQVEELLKRRPTRPTLYSVREKREEIENINKKLLLLSQTKDFSIRLEKMSLFRTPVKDQNSSKNDDEHKETSSIENLLGIASASEKNLLSSDEINQQKKQLVSDYSSDIRDLSNSLMQTFETESAQKRNKFFQKSEALNRVRHRSLENELNDSLSYKKYSLEPPLTTTSRLPQTQLSSQTYTTQSITGPTFTTQVAHSQLIPQATYYSNILPPINTMTSYHPIPPISRSNEQPSNQPNIASSIRIPNQNQHENTGSHQPFQSNTRNANFPLNQTFYNLKNYNCRESFLQRLKLIPSFSGKSRQEFTEFLDISDSLHSFCETQEEYMEFIFQITIQLRGEARMQITNRMDWREIKETLLNQFYYLSNRDIINSKVENLRQQKDETLLKYAERSRELLFEKNRAYNNITSELKSEHDRMVRKNFAKGISDQKIREKMLLKGSNSLEESISTLFEIESDFATEIRSNELFCNYCKNNGHRIRDCRKREQNNSEIGQLINLFKSVGVPSNGNPQRNNSNNSGRFNDNQNFSRNNNNNNGGFQRNNSNFPNYNNNSNYNNSNQFNRNNNYNQNNNNSNRNFNQNNNSNYNPNYNPNNNFNQNNNYNPNTGPNNNTRRNGNNNNNNWNNNNNSNSNHNNNNQNRFNPNQNQGFQNSNNNNNRQNFNSHQEQGSTFQIKPNNPFQSGN